MEQREPQGQSYVLARDDELDTALAYLKDHEQHGSVQVDKNMLRTLFNAASKKREPGSKLALLAATSVRDHIAPKDKGNVRIVEAYTSGIMKVFSVRAVRAKARRSAPTTVSPATVHPVGKYGQLVLL